MIPFLKASRHQNTKRIQNKEMILLFVVNSNLFKRFNSGHKTIGEKLELITGRI